MPRRAIPIGRGAHGVQIVGVFLTDKFDRALQYVSVVHAGQNRKRSEVPLMAHLIGVASIAMEYGATEDEAVGALLHDCVGEAGGAGRLEDIKHRFGEIVANIVDGCTDIRTSPKPPWRARKAAFIARLPHASASVRLVSASDKLCNARTILQDLRLKGNAAWEPLPGGKDGTLWYYRCLVQAFRTAGMNALVEELDRTVAQIEQLAKELEPEKILAAAA
jgi:(p)ppGpp synthase/HD superfamily hydrolase